MIGHLAELFGYFRTGGLNLATDLVSRLTERPVALLQAWLAAPGGTAAPGSANLASGAAAALRPSRCPSGSLQRNNRLGTVSAAQRDRRHTRIGGGHQGLDSSRLGMQRAGQALRWLLRRSNS